MTARSYGRPMAVKALIMALVLGIGCAQPPTTKDDGGVVDAVPPDDGGGDTAAPPGRPWGESSLRGSDALRPPGRDSGAGLPSPWRAVSVGADAACAIAENNELVCWGTDEYEIPQSPRGEFSEVSVGYWYACATDIEGYPHCWGLPGRHRDLDYGQTDAPKVPLHGISSGAWQACGLDEFDQIVCWGVVDGEYAPCPGRYAKISNGYGVNCGLHLDGSIECWGWEGQYSQETTPYNDASSVDDLQIIDVSSGYGHSCAVDEQGGLHCWGGASPVAVTPPDGFVFAKVAAGTEGNCGLSPSGELTCWQLDAPEFYYWDCLNVGGPPAGEGWLQISVRHNHACALSADRQISCWTCSSYYDPFLVIPPNPTD